jgi:hypothetical protein
MSKMITVCVECNSCGGTGLFQGMAEREGSAVICSSCNGSGRETLSYTPFNARKFKKGVKRVFKSSFGYMHGVGKHDCKDGSIIDFDAGGCSYEEWLNGTEPKPVETLYCPYIWSNHGIGDEPLLDCKEDVKLGSRISDCKKYGSKAECWKEFNSKKG